MSKWQNRRKAEGLSKAGHSKKWRCSGLKDVLSSRNLQKFVGIEASGVLTFCAFDPHLLIRLPLPVPNSNPLTDTPTYLTMTTTMIVDLGLTHEPPSNIFAGQKSLLSYPTLTHHKKSVTDG